VNATTTAGRADGRQTEPAARQIGRFGAAPAAASATGLPIISAGLAWPCCMKAGVTAGLVPVGEQAVACPHEWVAGEPAGYSAVSGGECG